VSEESTKAAFTLEGVLGGGVGWVGGGVVVVVVGVVSVGGGGSCFTAATFAMKEAPENSAASP
jgi:hypothetical protein